MAYLNRTWIIGILAGSALGLYPNIQHEAQAGSAPKVTPLSGASAITGELNARTECESGEFEAFLSQDSLLLYQLDVVQHGSFEFHVLPGNYNLVVVGSKGCFSENKIEVRPDQVQFVTANPAPTVAPDSSKHGSLLDWFVPSAYAWTDCPTCDLMAYYQMQPSFAPPMPYYGYYGSMAYPNFGFPGPWGGSGMYGGMYPGWGNVGMGKPVLYLDGKDGTKVDVRVKFAEGGNWLAAAPAHGESAWSGKLQGNHFVSAGADYRYLFYDYRTDGNQLQDERGFCTGRESLMRKLKTALKDSGFKENEIHDFDQYWSVKIPVSHRYCVYPQSMPDLQKLAHLEIEPKPASLTQLMFIIQVDEELTGKPGKFTHAPSKTWTAEPIADARAPASDSPTVQAREWGVGFFFTNGRP